MEIVCLMATHKRSEITTETIRMLQKQTYPLKAIVIVGDSVVEEGVAKNTGVHYVQHQNQPLGDKWQAGLSYVRTLNPDAVLICGSDEWLTYNWCEVTKQYIEQGFALVGQNIFYPCKVMPNHPLEIIKRTYAVGRAYEPIGSGRIFSKDVLETLNWELFPKNRSSGMDGYSYRKVLAVKTRDKIKVLNDIEILKILCVKSTWVSLSKFDFYKRNKSFQKFSDIQNPNVWLEENFPGSVTILKRLVPSIEL